MTRSGGHVLKLSRLRRYLLSILDHKEKLMHHDFMKLKLCLIAFLCTLSLTVQAGTNVKIPLLSYTFEPSFVEVYDVPAKNSPEVLSPTSSSLIEESKIYDNSFSIGDKSLWLHLQGVEWAESTNMLRFYLIPSADIPKKNQEEYYMFNVQRSKKSLQNINYKDNFLIDISYMVNKIKMNSDNKNLISGQRIIMGFKRIDLNGVANPNEVIIENARVFWVEFDDNDNDNLKEKH